MSKYESEVPVKDDKIMDKWNSLKTYQQVLNSQTTYYQLYG